MVVMYRYTGRIIMRKREVLIIYTELVRFLSRLKRSAIRLEKIADGVIPNKINTNVSSCERLNSFAHSRKNIG